MFELDPFDQDALLVCLAPDLDLRYERLYAYLQDDVTRRRPTVDLILRLLATSLEERAEARSALSPSGRLLGRGLLTVLGDDNGQMSLLARPLRVDERIVEYLLGSDRLDPRVAAYGRLFSAAEANQEWVLPADIQDGLLSILRDDRAPGSDLPARRRHRGQTGDGARGVRRGRAAAAAGRPASAGRRVDRPHPARAAVGRHARSAAPGSGAWSWTASTACSATSPESRSSRTLLRRLLAEQPGPTLLIGEQRWEPALWLPGIAAARIELRTLDVSDRVRLWRSRLHGQLAHGDLDALAGRFRLVDDDAIHAVAIDASSRAQLRGADQVGPRTSGSRRAPSPRRHSKASRGTSSHAIPGTISCCPATVWCSSRSCARACATRARCSSSGDTVASTLAAAESRPCLPVNPARAKPWPPRSSPGELGLDLYRIDLSAVVSKYIGETEKNLEKIFRAADQGEAVLLFDEADAIFGKRSEVRDARDRYANVEVAYLLQRLENYDGLAVLTTNLRGNIDEAFIRRLDCVMEFPLPEETERLRIWRLALPAMAPLADDVDLLFLARKFKLAGGHIRNIALTAGFLAAADGRRELACDICCEPHGANTRNSANLLPKPTLNRTTMCARRANGRVPRPPWQTSTLSSRQTKRTCGAARRRIPSQAAADRMRRTRCCACKARSATPASRA